MTITDKLAQSLRKLRDAFLGTSITVQAEAMQAAQILLAEYDSLDSTGSVASCGMKDHEKRELVNRLTAVAKEYHGAQQLRARIADVVLPAINAALAEYDSAPPAGLPSLPDLTPEMECGALSAWNLSEYNVGMQDTVHPMYLTAFKAGFQEARRAVESRAIGVAEPVALSDAEICRIAETLPHGPGENHPSWGSNYYRADESGQFTIPSLPANLLPFSRALLARAHPTDRAPEPSELASAHQSTALRPEPEAVAHGQWQPIETAPADTALLLTWWSDWVGEWQSEVNQARRTRPGTAHGQATHWMPLPEPPQAASGSSQRARNEGAGDA